MNSIQEYEEPGFRHTFYLFALGLLPLLTIAVGRSGAYSLLERNPPITLLIYPWLLSMLYSLKNRRNLWDMRLPSMLVVLLLIWACTSVASFVLYSGGYKYIFSRFIFISLIFLAFGCFNSREAIAFFERIFLSALIMLTLLTFLHAYGVLHLPFMHDISGRQIVTFIPQRTLGIRMSYGEHGILLSLGFAFIFVKIFSFRSNNYLYWMLLFLFLVQLIITQSRSTYLGFIATLAVFFVIGWLKDLLNKAGRLMALCYLTLLVIFFVKVDWGIFFEEVYIIGHGGIIERISENRFAIQLIKENPWMGVGYGNFFFLFSLGTTTEVLHNAFLNELVSVGLIFGSVYIFLFLWAIFNLWRIINNNNFDIYMRSFALSLLSAFIFAIVELNFFQGFFVEILAVMFALVARIKLWSYYYV